MPLYEVVLRTNSPPKDGDVRVTDVEPQIGDTMRIRGIDWKVVTVELTLGRGVDRRYVPRSVEEATAAGTGPSGAAAGVLA